MSAPAPAAPSDAVRPGAPVPREAALIVNVASRQGRARYEAMCEQLRAAGITLVSAEAIDRPARMRPAVRAAIASGVPMVILGGGDGTISSMVGEFAGTSCVFAPLPLGTANSFARSIGLGPDPEEAIATLATGRVRAIDLGLIDGVPFANSAAAGLSPMVGETIPHRLKAWLGILAYPVWTVRCLFAFRAFRLILRDGDGEQRFWASEVRILNGGFHAGIELSQEADVDSGDIMIQAVAGRSLHHLLWDWYARALGLRTREAYARTFRGAEFQLDSKPRRRISVDGEVRTKMPVHVSVARSALLIAAPGETQGSPGQD